MMTRSSSWSQWKPARWIHQQVITFLRFWTLYEIKATMDPILEVVALILGFLSWIMVGVAIPNRYWKVSTIDGTVITTSTIYENLWMSCATDSTGVHNCREFPSMLALSGRKYCWLINSRRLTKCSSYSNGKMLKNKTRLLHTITVIVKCNRNEKYKKIKFWGNNI